MYGVVLAAGDGTRLRPLTSERPKGLVEVAGRPILTHCFESLVAAGVDELVVVVGYRGDDIVSYYGERFGDTPVSYTVQEERLGSAHALATVAPRVDGTARTDEADGAAGTGDDGPSAEGDGAPTLLVLNGDNVCDADLSAVVSHHRDRRADATLLVDDVSREEATRTGVLAFDDDRLSGLVEKPDEPPSTTVPRGVYAFSSRVFEACRAVEPSPTGEYELTAAIDRLLAAGCRVELVELDGWCVNVNTPADRDRAERRLAERS